MFQEKLFNGHCIKCELIAMGKDYTLSVYGGDTPHVGSVVMSVSRPSLTGHEMSVTSSVINCISHKDEVIARKFAEAVARRKECTAVCVCGVHIDDITPEEIEQVIEAANRLLERVLDSLVGAE